MQPSQPKITPKITVRLRASSICMQGGELLMVCLEDPVNAKRYWLPPGGAPQEGESLARAAERENLEETGYPVRVDEKKVWELSYDFFWGGKTHFCKTTFFASTLLSLKTVQEIQDPHVREAGWFGLKEVEEHLAFHPKLSEFLLEKIKKNF